MLTNSSGNLFGWNAAITENRYASAPWLGGTIDASGFYQSGTLSRPAGEDTVTSSYNSAVYLIMAGPAATVRTGKARPFAHALVGGAFGTFNYSGLVTPPPGDFIISGTVLGNTLSVAAGGGVDLPLSPKFAIHTQADWVRIGEGTALNLFRGTGGIVITF